MMLWNVIGGLWKRPHEEKIVFSLDGIETVRYGEIEQVVDKLLAIGAALALFSIKGTSVSAPDPEHQWMYDFTDGMTEAEVQKASDATVSLITTLKEPQETAWHSDGTITVSDAGAMMLVHAHEIGFPFQGAVQQMAQGWTQRRIAEKTGGNLVLKIAIEGGDDVFSTCDWTVNRAAGSIEYSLMEARREKIKDYGLVLLNQEIKARGKIADFAASL